jgi:hypothetical protein
MKVVFYSDQCEYSKKLIAYLEKNNIKNLFKLINIDNTNVPDNIDVVPSIVDTELNQPMKGKKAFEYLLNLKFFNNPTNNVDYLKELPQNPNIPHDDKAIKLKILNFELNSNNTNTNHEVIFNDLFNNISNINLEQNDNNKSTSHINQEINPPINITNSKLAILLKMKRK